jgi:hypothetical protein
LLLRTKGIQPSFNVSDIRHHIDAHHSCIYHIAKQP